MDVTKKEITNAAEKYASNKGDMSKLSYKEKQIITRNRNQVSYEGRLIKSTEERAKRGY